MALFVFGAGVVVRRGAWGVGRSAGTIAPSVTIGALCQMGSFVSAPCSAPVGTTAAGWAVVVLPSPRPTLHAPRSTPGPPPPAPLPAADRPFPGPGCLGFWKALNC